MIKFAFSCEFAHICHCYKKRKNVSCDYVFTKEIYKKKTIFCNKSNSIFRESTKPLHWPRWGGCYIFTRNPRADKIKNNSSETVTWRCSIKKEFWKISQNSQENTFVGVSFLKKLQTVDLHFIWNETATLVFSCEFCEIFKSSFFFV